MCATWSTDNISKVRHKYLRDISRSDWRTHLYPTSRRWIKCAGMRDARCLMHAVSPLRYVGVVENWIGDSDRYSGATVDVPLSRRRLDPESGAVVAANRNDRFLGRIDPSVSPLQIERDNIAHLMLNPPTDSHLEPNLGRIKVTFRQIFFALLTEYFPKLLLDCGVSRAIMIERKRHLFSVLGLVPSSAEIQRI